MAFEYVVAGWSENRDRPEAYTINSHGSDVAPKLTLTPIETNYFSPSACEGIDPGGVILPAKAFEVVSEQRAITVAKGGSFSKASHVGRGFCKVTSVMKLAIKSRIVGRWPDKIGERIQATNAACGQRAKPHFRTEAHQGVS